MRLFNYNSWISNLVLPFRADVAGGRESWYIKSEIVNKRQSFYNYTEINSEKIDPVF